MNDFENLVQRFHAEIEAPRIKLREVLTAIIEIRDDFKEFNERTMAIPNINTIEYLRVSNVYEKFFLAALNKVLEIANVCDDHMNCAHDELKDE